MKAPRIQQVNAVLLCGILIVYVLYNASQILIPVAAAALLSMLVTPLSNKFEQKGMGRIWATLLCLLIIVLALSTVIALVVIQGNQMSGDIPQIKEKLNTWITKFQSAVYKKWDISYSEQAEVAKEQGKNILESSGTFLKNILKGAVSAIGGFIFVLVLSFLMMFQREKYEVFFLKLYNGSDPEVAQKIFRKATHVAQYYLLGRVLSIIILTVLYTIGLTIVGVKNAFLLSLIGALLTIIPYVGTTVGAAFPVLMALITGDSGKTALWALIVVATIQAADNYFIEPLVVGGEVNISAFFTILIIAIGGFIWGIAGMILFIPLLGITKIFFDHINKLEPYSFLIGDQEPTRQSQRFLKKLKSIFGKKTKSQ